nr:pre-mRNA-splicing factor ATP-dependent RNA helicase DEAH10-like isoform X2 [Nicotiana tomentosiformis]
MDSTELFTGETSATNPKAPSMKQKIEQQRKNLPIAAVERRLVEEVRNNDTLIIVGETGSGKTTPPTSSELRHSQIITGEPWFGT